MPKEEKKPSLKQQEAIDEEKKRRLTIILLMLFLGVVLFINFTNPLEQQPQVIQGTSVVDVNQTSFTSESELRTYLETQNLQDTNSLMRKSLGGNEVAMAMEMSESVADFSVSYSQTNNQVQGVDEADRVKTNGDYVFTISQNRLLITSLEDPTNLALVDELTFEENEYVQEFFIYENKVIVFSEKSLITKVISPYSLLPEDNYETVTKVSTYNFDGDSLTLQDSFEVSGTYQDARLIEGQVYMVANKYSYDLSLPYVYNNGARVMPEVSIIGQPTSSKVFTQVVSLNVENLDSQIESFLLDSSYNLYVSENALYVFGRSSYSYEDLQQVFFKEVILTLLPERLQEEVQSETNRDVLFSKLKTYYNTLSEKEVENFLEKVEEKSQTFYVEQEEKRAQTTISKISLNQGEIRYEQSVQVPGDLINQFALSEQDSNLRLVTTKSIWTGEETIRENMLIILDENLEEISRLGGIAEGEHLYSVRFMGDEVYFVTFEQVDPLFVVDISNPERPEILGELKIPGYSTYLHPYGENYLIGLGYTTKEVGKERTVTDGIKVSLFDITDRENPKEIDVEIFSSESSSLATNEHKAFLFNSETGLLAIPLREREQGPEGYTNVYKNSLQILSITQNGIELRGSISHLTDFDSSSWNSPSQITRSMYLGENLVSISQAYIESYDIESLKQLDSLELGYKTEKQSYPDIYY